MSVLLVRGGRLEQLNIQPGGHIGWEEWGVRKGQGVSIGT